MSINNLNDLSIQKSLERVYTISVPVGGDKFKLIKECEQDALNAGGIIVSIEDKGNLVIIKAEMPVE